MAGVMAVRPEFRRAGAALLCSVALFGASMIVFGLSTSLWVSVIALAVGGAVDNISVVIRHVLVQTRTPDHMRGRVTAVNSVFIECSNELGGFESGAVAAWLGPVASVVSGGIGTLVITGLIAWWLPDLRRLGRLVERPSDVMYSEAEEKSDE
jgi:MFS family permease